MNKLLKYLKPYRSDCILAPLFKMLEAIFELYIPLVVSNIIDVGIAGENRAYILKCCLIMVGLGVVGWLSAVSAQFFAARAAVSFASDLRRELFETIMNFSYSMLDKIGISNLITKITSDVNQIQNGVNLILRLLLRSPFIVFGSVIMAFSINYEMAFVFVVLGILLFVCVFAVSFFNIPLLKRVQERLDKITTLVRENILGIRVIRAFGIEEAEKEYFKTENLELRNTQEKAGLVSSILNPVTYVLVNVSIIVLLNVGAIKVNSGILSTGEVVALVNYMSQILVELLKLANLIIVINKVLASSDRVVEILQNKEKEVFEKTALEKETLEKETSKKETSKKETSDKETSDKEVLSKKAFDKALGEKYISFKNVSFRYNKKSDDVLSDISFGVEKGSTVGIIGGTGCGKTTLINLLSGFYEADTGEIIIEGKCVNDYQEDELHSMFGIVPQKAVLFSGTIRDNIKWGKQDATDEEILQAIEAAVCSDVVKSKGGLDYICEEGGRNFSGGQKQRLTIARALVRKPEILILDDSSSALDFATDLALRNNLKELDYSPTVFIVSQRSSSVLNADKIIVLDDGIIDGIGNHEELLSTSNVYREIFESQFGKEVTNYK